MPLAYLISGATGIAAATVRLACAGGAQVFVVSLDPTDCATLAGETGCAWHAGDLRQSAVADDAVAACVATFGRIDGIFAVAGGSGRRFGDGPVDRCTDDGWHETLALNLDTTFHLCRAALRAMLPQAPGPDSTRGSIVVTGSVLATAPEPQRFATHAYAVAKGAIQSLVLAMAAHYAPERIRVNAIAPGLVRTPMSVRAQGDEALLAYMKTKQPLTQDLLPPEDIARAALFLLGPDARAITGQTLIVDGGWSVSAGTNEP